MFEPRFQIERRFLRVLDKSNQKHMQIVWMSLLLIVMMMMMMIRVRRTMFVTHDEHGLWHVDHIRTKSRRSDSVLFDSMACLDVFNVSLSSISFLVSSDDANVSLSSISFLVSSNVSRSVHKSRSDSVFDSTALES